MDAKQDDQYGPAETKRRMEDALRRALNTPPKPHSEMVGEGKRESRRVRVELKSLVQKAKQKTQFGAAFLELSFRPLSYQPVDRSTACLPRP